MMVRSVLDQNRIRKEGEEYTGMCLRRLVITLMGIILSGMGSMPALADSREIEYFATGGLASSNVVRGRTIYHGLSLLGGAEIRVPSGKRGWWVGGADTFFPAQGEREGELFRRFHPYFHYEVNSGPGKVTLGGHGFFYNGESAPPPGNTEELFFSLQFDAVLNPSVALFQDIDATESRYLELGLRHEYVTDYYDKWCSVTPFIVSGFVYNPDHEEYRTSGHSYTDFGVELALKAGAITFAPQVVYTSQAVADRETGFRAMVLIRAKI